MFVSRFRLAFVALMCLALSLFVPVATAQDATPEATPATGVSREVLNTGLPETAPGYALTMTRVVIEPGGVAAAYMHPGMQLIYVESGTIHYTVVSGELPYTLAGEDGQAGFEGILAAGEEMEFGPGDRFTELEGMVHITENRGDVPVVNLASSLFAADLPVSIPVDVPATPAS